MSFGSRVLRVLEWKSRSGERLLFFREVGPICHRGLLRRRLFPLELGAGNLSDNAVAEMGISHSSLLAGISFSALRRRRRFGVLLEFP